MNFGGFQRLFERERRQDGGKALGQHGFAGAGRADQQDVMAAGGGDLQRALDRFLALDFGEIQFVSSCWWNISRRSTRVGESLISPSRKCGGFAEVLDGNDLQAGDDGGFGRVLGRDEQPTLALDRARRAMGKTPLHGRTAPLSASSPTITKLSS